MKTTRLIALSCFLPAAAIAQSVSPTFYANAEGLANNVFPFGNTTVPFRYSQIHDDVPTMVVNGFRFRTNAVSGTIYPAHTVTCDGWMSTALTPSTGGTGTFDNNHGLDKIQIITNRTYSHPASDPTNVPGAFHLDYPFDVPFFYASTAGSLCWEVIVTGKTQTTSITHDAVSTLNANPTLQVGAGGTGCIATGRTTAMSATGTSTVTWASGTGTLTFNGTNAPASAPSFHALGFDKTLWAGFIPLPFVIPGSTGAPSGTCNLYVDPLFTTGVTASSTGALTNAVPIPLSPAYHGVAVHSQWGAFDAVANPTGIVTSRMVTHGVSAPNTTTPGCRIYLSGNTGPIGTIAQAYLLVTQLY
ncbi:MAG: hypothetical protein HZB39_14350 [Planctomycetes bacterium]|nr:hypothetical protein [Planctomycetota bacterium]